MSTKEKHDEVIILRRAAGTSEEWNRNEKNRLCSWGAGESSKATRDNSFKKWTSSGLGWEVICGLQKAWGLYLVLQE